MSTNVFNNLKHKQQAGYLMILVLVFGSVLFTVTSSLIGFVVVQSRVVDNRIVYEQAGQIAEAGLNYYKWYLAHYPGDTTHGTTTPQPYVIPYEDSDGTAIGEYAISIDATEFCGETNSIRVTSEGHTYVNPVVRRTISARYARPTVADYAFILNSSVWAGADRVITGPYHSNGGIRMDGQNDSTVTSNLTSWTCTSSFGCNPNSTRDGVFTTTSNANTALFAFPSPPVNFAGVTVDLATIKNRAQTGGGLYFPAITNGSSRFGYRATFNADGTLTVRRVTGTAQIWAYSSEDGWQRERPVITNNNVLGTYTIPVNCPVVFFEDNIWLDGTVNGKVTLGVGNLIDPSNPHSIIINDNITYSSAATSGLLAIAQQNVLLGLVVPSVLNINGVFIAQNGRYGRNFYCDDSTYCTNAQRVPGAYSSYVFRDHEIMNGTIVSNGRVGTQWTDGGTSISGFLNRTNNYDRLLAADPPPFIPVTSDVYQFHEWRDE